MKNVLNKELNFNVFKNHGLRSLAKRLLERNPIERFSAIEAFNELNKIKIGVNLNKNISKTLNESPKKFVKNPNYESASEKLKSAAKSNFNRKFKGIFINDSNKNEEDENSDDNSIEKEKNNNNKKNNNEIRILIKKKNK